MSIAHIYNIKTPAKEPETEESDKKKLKNSKKQSKQKEGAP